LGIDQAAATLWTAKLCRKSSWALLNLWLVVVVVVVYGGYVVEDELAG